jgi:hypothetical protein
VKKESSGFETFDEFLQRLDSGATRIQKATDDGMKKIEKATTTEAIMTSVMFFALIIIYIPVFIAYILVRKKK